MKVYKPKRLRNFVFTLNNYSEDDEKHIKESCEKGYFRYLIYGREKGESGTPHLQGYGELTRQTRFSTAKGYISDRVHIEKRRGTAEQAANYCCKEDTEPFVHGVRSKQGFRTDIEDIKAAVSEGASLYDIMDTQSASWRYLNATRTYRLLYGLQDKSFRQIETTVYYGPAGSGKTRRVFEGNPDVYFVPNRQGNSLWFDGYDGHSVILFDDYYGDIPLPTMLRILDGYPLQLPVKGGFVCVTYTKVYFTSNIHPKHWYTTYPDSFKRRLTHIEEIDSEVGSSITPTSETP